MVMQKQGIESDRNGLFSYPMKKTDSSKATSELDIWSSIFNQKTKDEASKIKTSYIHPLVKKSKNYLSQHSLDICTEIIGSETGSDWLSSDENIKANTLISQSFVEYNSHCLEDETKLKEKAKKKLRCFPPPLSSQSQQLQMRSHRDNGRLFLFLEVGSVPSRSNFVAKRQDSRLILTFDNNHDEDEVDDELEKDDSEIQQPSIPSLELEVNKKFELGNKSPKLLEKLNKVTNFEDVKVLQHGSLPRSLPLINAYQYYWQPKNVTSTSNKVGVFGNMNIHKGSNDTSQQLFVLRGKNGDYLVHNLKCYKDSKTRRSFLSWDPCCIAI